MRVPDLAPICLYAVEALESRCLLSGGQFDPTFGTGGAAWGALFPNGQANAVALQADGKILAADTDLFGLAGG